MTEAQYAAYLAVGVVICAAGAVLNLVLARRRGPSALLMAAAFVVFGSILWLLRLGVDSAWIVTASMVLVGLLVADLLTKVRKKEKSR